MPVDLAASAILRFRIAHHGTKTMFAIAGIIEAAAWRVELEPSDHVRSLLGCFKRGNFAGKTPVSFF